MNWNYQDDDMDVEADLVFYKTDEEVELIRQSCLLVSKTLAEVAKIIRPGVTGKYIDRIAEEFILDHKALPAFKGYGENPFPNTLCISINEGVVHGIPTDLEFKDGDVVSVDCGTYMNGFFGDSAYTFALGNVKPSTLDLLSVTLTSLYEGINNAVHGKRLGDIGFGVQDYVQRKNRYSVVRELVGHGIGRELHEAPSVPNYGKRGQGMVLRNGLVIAIEPMVNAGRKEVVLDKDGWTIKTIDNQPSAHYEHTVCIRKGKADILSSNEFIDAAIKNNAELQQISIKS